MPAGLLESHTNEDSNDDNPIEVVRQNRAVGCRILPAEDGVGNSPSTTTIQLGITAVDVPNALTDVVGAWSRSCFGSVTADYETPFVVLEVPDCF